MLKKQAFFNRPLHSGSAGCRCAGGDVYVPPYFFQYGGICRPSAKRAIFPPPGAGDVKISGNGGGWPYHEGFTHARDPFRKIPACPLWRWKDISGEISAVPLFMGKIKGESLNVSRAVVGLRPGFVKFAVPQTATGIAVRFPAIHSATSGSGVCPWERGATDWRGMALPFI